ncbi:MAG: hypothetical protein PW734_04425 [Verrucomicrobium sp.]|nr:hypothetical protein [Verrucomicrobium sp.]
MPLDPALLALLCCPENLQPLSEADAALVAQVNARIASGAQRNRAENPVTEPVDALLVREDRACGYPVRGGIPVLLVEEALPL